MTKEKQLKLVRDFKAKYGIEGTEEDVVTTIHLMNNHLLDRDSALDQSSRGSSDYGIDGWYLDAKTKELTIYQSKFSDSKTLVLQGLKSFLSAGEWLEKVIIKGEIDKLPTNNAISNLYSSLTQKREGLKKINFVLLSPYSESDLIERDEYESTERKIRESTFFKEFHEREIRINLEVSPYNYSKSIAPAVKKYPVKTIPQSTITLRDTAKLDLSYISLHSLVQLYRQRGDLLFHKNVRLSLYSFKDAKHRVVNPMKNTLEEICSGRLSPNIFPFYHVGITISATTGETQEDQHKAVLESPYVLNGCQTITIGHHYLRELEDKQEMEKITRFKEIVVMAKIVIGTTDEELREITICNNRQTPIENWQLFSNDPIHIAIEDSLRDMGIFYERQKGRFEAEMKRTEYAKNYYNTNGTFISVEQLGQLISVSTGIHQYTAKMSEIFINQENHDKVFTRSIQNYGRDAVYISNIYKAAKRALDNYLRIPAHSNEETWEIFRKPIVKAHIYWLMVLFYYQKKPVNTKTASVLLKVASSSMVDELEAFLPRIITKIKNYYKEEMGQNKEVPSKKLTPYFERTLAVEVGVDPKKGEIPFTENTKDWSRYDFQGKPFDWSELDL